MLILLLTIASVHLAALVTPGPDFFFISQVAASRSKSEAMKGVLGITLGIVVWAGIALLGLHVLIQKISWLQRGLLIAGGLYLCYLGFQLVRSSFLRYRQKKHLGEEAETQPIQTKINGKRVFLKGFLTNLSNPKAVIYFGSVFVIFVGDGMATFDRVLVFTLVVMETFIWFSFVAMIFSLPVMKRGYQNAMHWIDGIAGVLFIGFGATLLVESFQADTLFSTLAE